MSTAAAVPAAVYGILKRDFLLALSYRVRFFTTLASGFLSLTIFYYIAQLLGIGGEGRPFESPEAYYSFAVIGLIVLQVLNSTIAAPPMTLRQELIAGTFERIVLSPFGPVRGLMAMLVFPFVYALVVALAMLTFASLVFGVELQWSTVPLVVPMAILSSFAFAPFGMLILATVILVKQAAGGATWIVAGLSLISGFYFPVTLLPDWIAWASEVQPFTPAVDLMRHVLVGQPLRHPLALDLAKLVGFAVVTMPIGAWTLDLAVRRGRRRGNIIEY